MKENRLQPECIRCLVERQLYAYPADAAPDKQLDYMQRLLGLIAGARRDVGVPVLSREIKRLKEELFGTAEDYTQIKRHFNALMLARENELQSRIDAAADPLMEGLKCAFTGNYIDFGAAMHKVDEQQLDELLASPPPFETDEQTIARLRAELLAAKRIVYLTDNCGEIVMDKLLMRVIRHINPEAELIAIVRGDDVLNDATREDAQQVGLDTVARVMDNGSDVAGTWLEEISPEANRTLETADVILAKGQANFETMRGCGMNVYYLFMCKCSMFASRFNVPRFTGILTQDSRF
ncbi:MAG: DUF89 family protein [Clostridia bacterium]|nr:DUF89 family protein [Clostridia bacterium]